jgi:hypothetical protein
MAAIRKDFDKVPTRILRNLGILKIRLLRPTRSNQYNTGHLNVS